MLIERYLIPVNLSKLNIQWVNKNELQQNNSGNINNSLTKKHVENALDSGDRNREKIKTFKNLIEPFSGWRLKMTSKIFH